MISKQLLTFLSRSRLKRPTPLLKPRELRMRHWLLSKRNKPERRLKLIKQLPKKPLELLKRQLELKKRPRKKQPKQPQLRKLDKKKSSRMLIRLPLLTSMQEKN
jgi:hypothetical protein